MNDNSIDERLRTVEQSLSWYKGAFTVASAAILALLGITTFITIPNAAEQAITKEMGPETRARIENAIARVDTINRGRATQYPELSSGGTEQSFTTPNEHLFCALTKVQLTLASANANKVCKVAQQTDNKWTLTALADEHSSSVTCRIVCFL